MEYLPLIFFGVVAISFGVGFMVGSVFQQTRAEQKVVDDLMAGNFDQKDLN